jgi:nitrate/nitrite-specific signal transduction histidine kinase
LESLALGLVDSSDDFVTNLGQTTERNSQNLIILEVALAIISFIILMLIFFLALKILKPIFSLITATSEAKKGNLDVKVSPKGNDELSTLSESFNSMISSMKKYVKW